MRDRVDPTQNAVRSTLSLRLPRRLLLILAGLEPDMTLTAFVGWIHRLSVVELPFLGFRISPCDGFWRLVYWAILFCRFQVLNIDALHIQVAITWFKALLLISPRIFIHCMSTFPYFIIGVISFDSVCVPYLLQVRVFSMM